MSGYEVRIGENEEPGSCDIAVRYKDDNECVALFLSDGSHVGNHNATELAKEFVTVHNYNL